MVPDVNPSFSIRAEDCRYIAPEEIPNLCEHYTHPLRALHVNIRSLRANYDELLNLIASYEESNRALHVLLLCETALNDANTVLFGIPGFDAVYANRKSHQRGGVAIYVRKGLNFTQRPDLSIFSEGKFETIFIELSLCQNSQPIIIGEIFLSEMTRVLDRHAPAKQIKIPSKSFRREPWFTKGLQRSSRRLSKLYSTAAKCAKNSHQHTAYVKYRNVYNSAKRAAKQLYYDNLFSESKNDIKRTWKILNDLTKKSGKDNSPVEKLQVDDVTITEPKAIADAFARFFADVGPKQAGLIASHVQTDDQQNRAHLGVPPSHHSVFLHPVTQQEIIRIIDSLKNKKSLGLDL
ncbi:hypothetical protein CAPTEDRAFT_194072, partial [Capitella teleta]